LYVRTEGDRLAAVSFVGSGCCISKASASLLTEAVLGRTKAEVAALFQQVRQLVTTGTSSGGGLGKLAVFAGVYKFPARVKCAMLPWHAVLAAIEGQSAPVTTESESQ
jgi:nitrogen fixation NifU-like protein